MNSDDSIAADGQNGRISWSIVLLAVAICAVLAGILAPSGLLPPKAARNIFLIAMLTGVASGFVVNWLRPKYTGITGRWGTIYAFLLRQLPPSD